MHTPLLNALEWSILVAALAAAAMIDVRERRIPNLLVAALALAGVVRAAWLGGFEGLGASLGGTVAGVAFLYLQWCRGWMGAGDVKLLGAIGAFTGVLGAAYVLLLASVLGGVFAVLQLVRLPVAARAQVQRNVMALVATGSCELPEPSQLSRGRGVPFGVALALAAALVTFMGIGR